MDQQEADWQRARSSSRDSLFDDVYSILYISSLYSSVSCPTGPTLCWARSGDTRWRSTGQCQPIACKATERGCGAAVRCIGCVWGPRRQGLAVAPSAISTNHCALSSRRRLDWSLIFTRVCMRWPRGPTLSFLGGPAEVQPFWPLRAFLAGELSAASWRPIRSARWPPACTTPAGGPRGL